MSFAARRGAPPSAPGAARRLRWVEGLQRQRVALLAITSALTLILGTIVTFLDLQRYELPGLPVLDEAGLAAGFQGWRIEGEVRREAGGGVLLQNRDPGEAAYLRRTIELPPGRTSLRLAIDVATAAVRPGDEGWKTARVYLVQETADGRHDWNQPHMLVSLAGTTSRQRYEAVFEMPSGIPRAMLGIELAHATGRMEIDDLELSRLEELPSFRLAASLLIAGWGLLAFWVVETVYRGIRSRPVRAWVLVTAGVLGAGLLMPSLLRQALIDSLTRGFGLDLANPDAIGHGLVFALLALLLRCGRPRDPLLLHLVGWLLLGVATEVVQLFTPDRDPELADWLVDALGASLGLVAAELGLRLQSRLRSIARRPGRSRKGGRRPVGKGQSA